MSDESLGWAVFDGDTAGVRAILLDGADPNAVDEDGTPLVELAVHYRRTDVLRVLVEFGANLDVPSLLHNLVAGQDLPDMLPVLLELGADANARDSTGWMPLHFVSAYGYQGSARVLLNAGAEINAITSEGLTAAEIAQRNGHGALVTLLVRAGTSRAVIDELDHVVDLCDRGSFSEVSAFVRRLGAERPEDPFPVLLSALVHARQGDAGTARELVDRALNLTGSPDADCLAIASMIFRELGSSTQAVLYGLRATMLAPHDWRAHTTLARAMATASGLHHDAARAARRAVELAPEEAAAHLALGKALLSYPPGHSRVHEEGVAALARAAELDSGSAAIQHALAEARSDKSPSARLGCLAFLAFVVVFAAGYKLIGMEGSGIDLLLQIDPDRPDSMGPLVVVALGGVVWGLVALIRLKRKGERPILAIGERRALARELHKADEERLRITASTVAALVCMVPLLLTGSLAATATGGTPAPTALALLPLPGVVVLSVLGWSAARWWLGPGQTQKALKVSGILRACLLTTYLLVIVTALLSWAQVTGDAVWITLTVLHFAWFAASLGPLIIAERFKRRRARSGLRFPR
ncbi:hypothetical protein GCM10009556_019550 [Acrocarpospora pleiomorpha]|uniref:ankyrin repeat domain-containing protein n=1 Tax=Acrocarpospora pleiomorpha TaxID=90975 RepID=UPI0012D2A758|nr:ankyrin repeat domain-containing protein [Acrocarpospora pleiomorpha]